MIKGFRDFLMRGNVVDLAVAVIIGAAFTAIVTSFVTNIITPLIAAIVGKPDFSALVLKAMPLPVPNVTGFAVSLTPSRSITLIDSAILPAKGATGLPRTKEMPVPALNVRLPCPLPRLAMAGSIDVAGKPATLSAGLAGVAL